MLHTRTAIEYHNGTQTTILPAVVVNDRFGEESRERRTLAAERALDEVLADSFPASDPPSWNLGIARLDPEAGLEPHAARSDAVLDTDPRTGVSDIIDVSRPSRGDRTFLQGLGSLAGAAGIALLVPVAILLVGLPIALSVRGVLELLGWLFNASSG